MAKAPLKTAKSNRPRTIEPFEIDIKTLNEEGIGIGTRDNKEVWVAGTLPGEKVLATRENEGQYRIIARLQKILVAHPRRVAPPCRHARDCQGCPLLQLNYSEQLNFKQEKLRHAFSSYANLKDLQINAIAAAPEPLAYRTTAKLVFAKNRGRVQLGLYRRGTHEVVNIGDCPLHHPLLNQVAGVVREEVQRQNIFVYDPRTGRGLLRYLTIKVAPESAKVMVTFITSERNYRELNPLAKWLQRKVPEVVSVHQNVNTSSGNVIFGRETHKVLGLPDLITRIGEIRLRISPTSFFQVNHSQAAAIYALVRQWAGLRDDEHALDVYCGIGGIALHLAKDAGRVTGIEILEAAVQNARENARLNHIDNCNFQAGDSLELLRRHISETKPARMVVLNPPRSGCDKPVLEAAAALHPRMLIYVSCNPETLARDLDILHGCGLRAEMVQPVDMFPQTAHVESVARLRPLKEEPRTRS
ncbi:MAG: 23S rRNA (uracil(1939)-C(5))-methyltransferase RlmD [Deltaproteobacteria bacterium]|nr:23S rRNA (uracil(1939)-C(5))-methyltransferase RlmD [Deltaproteobacteria bacterium]